MIKLVHAADFHLDAPFATLSAEQATGRRQEQRAALERLADLCREERADLLLLSGDLFDSPRPYYESLQALSRTLGALRLPVFIAPGNHDFWAARSPWTAAVWPENVHIFSQGAVEAVDLPERNCTVYGFAFTGPYQDKSPLEGFHAAADDGRVHLMVLHGDTESAGRYGPISPADIAGSGLTYLALGHIHQGSGLQRTGDTWWAYPGCLEGRGFDELGDKGALVVTVESGAVSARFVPLCERRYRTLTVDLGAAPTPEEALTAALPADGANDICRILLTGETDVAGPDLAALEAIAAPRFYSVTLRDQTRVRRDLWSRAGEDSLTGLFLRQMRARLDAAGTDADRALVEKAVRFGLAALENGEDPCP